MFARDTSMLLLRLVTTVFFRVVYIKRSCSVSQRVCAYIGWYLLKDLYTYACIVLQEPVQIGASPYGTFGIILNV